MKRLLTVVLVGVFILLTIVLIQWAFIHNDIKSDSTKDVKVHQKD